jgi:beta-ribofuranosylaminobenzene 5'-phosphate synthase
MRIDKKLGIRLSPLQRVLLTTDGSVTRILEAIAQEPVEVETVRQEIMKADSSLARALGVKAGEEVNYRVVNLKNSGGVLMRAVSYAPMKRLRPEFKAPIMRKDEPIGRIMAELGIEARREVKTIETLEADEELSRVFGIPKDATLLRRTYNILHSGEVILNITEVFPHAFFK